MWVICLCGIGSNFPLSRLSREPSLIVQHNYVKRVNNLLKKSQKCLEKDLAHLLIDALPWKYWMCTVADYFS